MRYAPDQVSQAAAQPVCNCGAQSERNDQHRHADQAKIESLVIVEQPVVHAAEDDDAGI
jgi:hypothetical protein